MLLKNKHSKFLYSFDGFQDFNESMILNVYLKFTSYFKEFVDGCSKQLFKHIQVFCVEVTLLIAMVLSSSTNLISFVYRCCCST